MRPKVVQCLCPQRHCILALAFKDEVPDAEAIAYARGAVASVMGETHYDPETLKLLGLTFPLNPWCGLCGAKADTWRYEVGVMREQDWDRAVSELRANEQAQQESAALLKAMGLAYDKPSGTWN